MKKSTFGILATVALAFSPVAAFAQQAQISSQSANNNGAAVGHGNYVDQEIDQTNYQTQLEVPGYYHQADPQLQISGQDASNNGAAVGNYNYVDQNIDQYSDQWQQQFGY
ncbi:hypothetical protein IQ238_12365 [Pleurocapsales cyanobacterium LEGE 06147]|nr:hypothetical protein [Pleurocapsales cyanobacterium LEGE 06147]